MSIVENQSCFNANCPSFGLKNQGNIAVRGKYGRKGDKILLYCRTCGKRFAPTLGTPIYGAHLPLEIIHDVIHHAAEGCSVRATARLLKLSNSTVNDIILKVGEHIEKVHSELMVSLQMTEVQLDELWTFVKKKRLKAKKNLIRNTENTGSGQPLMPQPAL
jgi:transposase-like protein